MKPNVEEDDYYRTEQLPSMLMPEQAPYTPGAPRSKR